MTPNESNNNYIVQIENLKKSFEENDVLKDVNLSVEKGENVAIIGQSGIGKSVLIKCMVRLIEPDQGNIHIFGQDMLSADEDHLDEIRKKIGFLFQGGALYDSMTVRENLEFPVRRNEKFDREEINQRVVEVLESVKLKEAINLYPSELSGGMKKRIALARTLIMKPQLILFDEPTTGLDPITSKEISNLIVHIKNIYNTTSMIITHDTTCVRITASKIYVLKDGIFYASGTYDEMRQSKDPWIQKFFN